MTCNTNHGAILTFNPNHHTTKSFTIQTIYPIMSYFFVHFRLIEMSTSVPANFTYVQFLNGPKYRGLSTVWLHISDLTDLWNPQRWYQTYLYLHVVVSSILCFVLLNKLDLRIIYCWVVAFDLHLPHSEL